MPLMKKIQPIITDSHVIQSDSMSGVLNLILSDSKVFTVSYYPLLKRFKGVSEHRLICIPFDEEESKGDLCLFYSGAACKAYPILHEIVSSIKKGFAGFLQ